MSAKRASAKLDMTNGSIVKLILLFALPICAGNVLQLLYNTVDKLVIGNFCDSASLAAVGTSSQPVEMLLCIFLGIGTGVSILVSHSVGGNDQKRLKTVTATAIGFLYCSAIPLTVIGLFVGPLILRFMQVPADAWDYAVAYLQIILLGVLGNMGYNMNAGILRGLGDSRSTLIFLIISCIANIVMDLLFVVVFHMNVSGVAVATTISMYISWLFSIFYIKKHYPELEFTFLPQRIDKNELKSIIQVGLPLGLNNSIYSVGHMVLQILINMQGSTFVAACSVATTVTGIANVAIGSFSAAATTFSGQNFGAQKYRRLVTGGRLSPICNGVIAASAGIIVTIFCRPILSVFTKDSAAIDLAVLYIYVVLPSYWTYAVFNCILNFANGLGEVRYSTMINLLMLWAVRIPCACLIAFCISGTYVMACYPISFAFGMICMLHFFRTKQWANIKQKAAEETAV